MAKRGIYFDKGSCITSKSLPLPLPSLKTFMQKYSRGEPLAETASPFSPNPSPTQEGKGKGKGTGKGFFREGKVSNG